MTKYLVITHIPKDEKVLKDVLKELGDYTWSDEGIENWMKTISSCIYYDSTYDSYFAVTTAKIPVTTKHIVKPYWNIIKRVEF